MHNPQPNVFDFGDGQNDFSPFLNLTAFIQIAREEDLFVFVRAGPYICAEWDFGGMPRFALKQTIYELNLLIDNAIVFGMLQLVTS